YAAPIVVDTTTARTPIASEMRAPHKTRASTSRAYASVPKRSDSDGGAFLSRTMSSCSTQLCAVRSGPAIAATTSAAMTISAHRPPRWAISFVHAELRLFTDARVEGGMESVGHQVADDDEHRAYDHGCRHQIVVSAPDRARGE